MSWALESRLNLIRHLWKLGCLGKTIHFCAHFSLGGNYLLNIGPNKEGVILPQFETRLREVGDWLKINGDAIYGTTTWKYQNDTVTPNVW